MPHPLLRLWDHKLVGTRTSQKPPMELTCSKEERVLQNGADTSVVKKKHERNPMAQEQKRKELRKLHNGSL